MLSVLHTIKAIVAKVKRKPELAVELGDQADLIKEVALDSLELLQFMLDLEERLEIRIDFDALEFEYLSDISLLAGFLERMPAREAATGTS